TSVGVGVGGGGRATGLAGAGASQWRRPFRRRRGRDRQLGRKPKHLVLARPFGRQVGEAGLPPCHAEGVLRSQPRRKSPPLTGFFGASPRTSLRLFRRHAPMTELHAWQVFSSARLGEKNLSAQPARFVHNGLAGGQPPAFPSF